MTVTAREARKIEEYKRDVFPSNQGVVVKPVKGNTQSFIPREAIEASEEAREVHRRTPNDPYSDEKVSHEQPVVDSSEETMGG